MIFYCNGEKIKINNNKRKIGHGSEGIVYRIGDSTYKIYYESALRDNYGLKEHHHQYLSTIPTKQIVMPEHAIYDEFGNYVGYSAPFIEGNQKDKTGISMLDKKVFLDNLRCLSADLKLLSDYLVVCADIQPINYVYNQNEEKMYIIDPGRYKHHIFIEHDKYYHQNIEQFGYLLDLLIMSEIYKYKPIDSKRKQILLKNYISNERKKSKLNPLEFYEKNLEDYPNVYEYVKSLNKYIR